METTTYFLLSVRSFDGQIFLAQEEYEMKMELERKSREIVQDIDREMEDLGEELEKTEQYLHRLRLKKKNETNEEKRPILQRIMDFSNFFSVSFHAHYLLFFLFCCQRFNSMYVYNNIYLENYTLIS